MGKKGKYNQRNQQQQVKKKNFIITEQHLMDKTHMQPIQYPTFLPEDSLYEPFAITEPQQQILRIMLKQLNYTLFLQFKNFWATILYNPSFKTCIHSCIQFFHRKWLNSYTTKTKQEQQQLHMKQYEKVKDRACFEYMQQLMRIVLIIYWRILHFQEENAELANLYHIKNQIIMKYILDVPRILEIVQIYGDTNQDIVRVMVKNFTNLSNTLYTDFTQQIIQPMITRMTKNLNIIKKTTDRQQFGIQYNYKRTIAGQLSPGQLQLQKKVKLLCQIISFYQTLSNIYKYFPTTWSQYTRFNLQIHSLSQNTFIEIEQAYKIWNNHQQGQKLYSLMNCILRFVIEYFVHFFQQCQAIFIDKNVKSSFKEAYMKCIDRVIEGYGRRASLGKKASSAKRYMDLYREILKEYKLDEFLNKLYVDQVENATYGINMEYLVDFKIAIDETLAKLHGRPISQPQINQVVQQKTQADINQRNNRDQDFHPQPQSQQQPTSQSVSLAHKPSQQVQQFTKLQQLISKRDRQDDYYQRLYKNYRTKIVIEYDDQYDDLVDYEKRPMFEDNNKEEQDSSDGSSGEEYDSQVEKLHLVKSDSNVERARGVGTLHHQHSKYDRKEKVKYVPVKQAQAKAILNRQANRPQQQQKPTYTQRQPRQPQPQKQQTPASKQYNDQDCYQQCRAKNKQQKKERQKKQQQTRKQTNNKNEEEESDDDYKRGNQGGGRGNRGGRGRGGSNHGNQHNKPKGSNTNKKKYVAKD